MREKKDFLKCVCRIGEAFGTTLNRDELLNLIVQTAIDTMEVKAACLHLIDEASGDWVAARQKGLSDTFFETGLTDVRKITSLHLEEGYIFVYDATTDPRLNNREAKKAEGIISILAVPIAVKGHLIGSLALYTAAPRKFSPAEIDFLTCLASQGGMAIESARLLERIRENTRLFYNLAANINASLDVKEILHILSRDIARTLGVKAASIRLLDEDKRILELVASYGLSEKYLSKGPISAEKSIAEALRGEAVVIKNAAVDDGIQYRKEKEEEGIVSILCVPIKAKEKVIGVLRLYSCVEREFTEDEIMLVTALAQQGGLAIQNASLYLMLQDDLKDMREDIWIYKSWF